MSYFNNKIEKRTFTMVELLAVMVLMLVVAGIGIGAYSYGMTKLKENRTRTTIAQVEGALESLKAKYGYYPATPTNGSGTTDYRFYLDLNVNHSGFSGSYKTDEPSGTAVYPQEYMEHYRNVVDYEKLKKKAKRFGSSNYSVVVDGWGQPLYYRCPGLHNPASYDLYSAGADGKVGTTNDNLWNASYSLGVLENSPVACNSKLADDIANF